MRYSICELFTSTQIRKEAIRMTIHQCHRICYFTRNVIERILKEVGTGVGELNLFFYAFVGYFFENVSHYLVLRGAKRKRIRVPVNRFTVSRNNPHKKVLIFAPTFPSSSLLFTRLRLVLLREGKKETSAMAPLRRAASAAAVLLTLTGFFLLALSPAEAATAAVEGGGDDLLTFSPVSSTGSCFRR